MVNMVHKSYINNSTIGTEYRSRGLGAVLAFYMIIDYLPGVLTEHRDNLHNIFGRTSTKDSKTEINHHKNVRNIIIEYNIVQLIIDE